MLPPVAPRKPHVHTEHGVVRDDPWHWLKDRDDPDTLAYIEAEEAYTQHVVAPLADLRKRLFEEMKGSMQETDSSAPVRKGPWWYYSRTVEGLSHPILCRKLGTDGVEEVILDVNAVAADHAYTAVVSAEVSPDHRLLAYAVDHTGRELFDVVVVELASGRVVDDALKATGGDLTWATDNATLFYDELDDTLRPWRIRRHRVGAPADADPVVMQEDDPRFRLATHRTRTDAYVVVSAVSSRTVEQHVIPADRPDAAPRVLQGRVEGLRYGVEHAGDWFYALTNDGDDPATPGVARSVNFRLVRFPVAGAELAAWQEVIGHRPGVQLAEHAVFAQHLAIVEREGGHVHLWVQRHDGSGGHRISMPEPAYELGLEQNPEFTTTELRFGYESMVTPPTTFAYGMDTRERRVLKVVDVLGGYDPDAFEVKRLHAPSVDGVMVPISLVAPKGHPRDGSGPLVLYGYGSYGLTIDPGFAHTRLVLLKRGVAFAIAHPRGGGLLGRPWYEAAKFGTKQRTFDDFIACARHLQAEGWGSPATTAIYGGSAGGLLMGATINQAPELFRACVAAVPFVDVVSTMLDETLPLTTNEWEEWGNPREREAFGHMLAYSPYDNVADHPRFPALLITSGLNDPRVAYWEPTKWCAKLRATLSNPPEILLHTHLGAGHQGQSGRYGHLEDRAFDYAWILGQLGLR